MFTVKVDRKGFDRLERALMMAAGPKQLHYASAQALNDCARAAAGQINQQMATVFSRPTPFTERAAIAPRDLAAMPDRLAAVTTLRPIQAQYLLHEEIGGVRTPAENTRRKSRALTLPGKNLPPGQFQLDRYGNLPAGTVKRIKGALESAAKAREKSRHASNSHARPVASRDRGVFYVPRQAARPNLPGGFWGRLPGHRIAHLIAFAGEATYQPRLRYFKSWETTVRETWPQAMVKRLQEAVRTAR